MDAGQNSWDRANQLLRIRLTALGLIAIWACLGLDWAGFSDREWHQFALFLSSTIDEDNVFFLSIYWLNY